jgi:hypothetical protein
MKDEWKKQIEAVIQESITVKNRLMPDIGPALD